MPTPTVRTLLALTVALAGGTVAIAEQNDAKAAGPLAPYFGFEPSRVLVVDRDAGPMVSGDFNGDGRPDLLIVNNSKSRIEVNLLREKPMTQEEVERGMKVNQLRPSPHYDRKDTSLPQRLTAVRTADVNGDKKLDLVYVGANPAEIVVLAGEGDGTFKPLNRQRVRGLGARQSGLFVADVMGDSGLEVVTLAEERIVAYPLSARGELGEPRRLGSGGAVLGMMLGDYNGDSLQDILAVVGDEQMPLRVWLQRQDPASTAKRGLIGAELRFESPALRAVDRATFSGRKNSSLGIVERVSRRVVFYDLVSSAIEPAGGQGERETQAEVFGFSDGANKDRSAVTFDIDGDGMLDLLATNAKNNTIDLYRQAAGAGLGDPEAFSAFKQPKQIAVAGPGAWDSGQTATVFVLSEEEKAVGAARYDSASRSLSFPTPLPVKTSGASPVAIGYVSLDGVGTLAVVARNKRDHTLELHQPSLKGEGDKADGITTIPLTGVNRPPQSMLAADVDQDGFSDLLLFTPGEPMVMVRGASEKGRLDKVLTSETMPNFGLVQAAGPTNTAMVDWDNNGKPELLIADKNFVRACRYDQAAGWKVVAQVTVPDSGTELVGLTQLPGKPGDAPTLVVSDRGNNRMLFVSPAGIDQRVRLMGFTPGAIFAGEFAGDKQPGILALADDAFGLVRLAGQRVKLEQFAAFRSEAKDRSEYNLEFGDVNGDGFMDAVVLDAGEQMLSILTFSASRNVQLGTEFKVFESRLFTGGEAREFEPRDLLIADFTGDGRDDVALLIHDRVIIYPQMTKAPRSERADANR